MSVETLCNKVDERLTIIVPAHDSYLDVYSVFEKLLIKNWGDCPYRLVLSCNNAEYKSERTTVLNNGDECFITARIYNAIKRFKSELYLVLLEDCFITSEVNTAYFEEIIELLQANKIEFCRLMPVGRRSGRQLFEYPKTDKPYVMNLMGLICTEKFADEYFKKNQSGWDYENERLGELTERGKTCRFTDKVICNRNILNLVHGIAQGEWIRSAYKQLIKENGEIDFSFRKLRSRKKEFKARIYSVVGKLAPKSRRRLKSVLRKFGLKFQTDN